MTGPNLTASETALVRAAGSMARVEYPGGSVIAVDGRTVLFRAGSAEAFGKLWAQAEGIRAEVRNG